MPELIHYDGMRYEDFIELITTKSGMIWFARNSPHMAQKGFDYVEDGEGDPETAMYMEADNPFFLDNFTWTGIKEVLAKVDPNLLGTMKTFYEKMGASITLIKLAEIAFRE